MLKAVKEITHVQKIEMYLFCISFPTMTLDFHYLPFLSLLPIETVFERTFIAITIESAKGQ